MIISYKKLKPVEKKLIDAAETARELAYNPYSHFYVGAALLSSKGKIITGSNVENASYGLAICGERAAFIRANALGIRSFTKIGISSRGETYDLKDPSLPCGACRQWINEFSQISGNDIEIISASTDKSKIIKILISKLLPKAFGPLDLNLEINKLKHFPK